VAGVLTLAVITGLIAIVSTWVKREALDTNNWTNTSSQLLANENIRTAVGAYLVNELFSSVDVAGELQEVLPDQAAGLAGPASAGLRELAGRAAPELLARPRVQDAWRNANRTAHKQFLQIINGGSKTVSTSNGEVVLDLHSLVTQLANQLGVGPQLAAARAKVNASTRAKARGVAEQQLNLTLSPASGRLVIMRSKQLKTAQDIVKAIRHISIIFTIVSLGLFALAIGLASGWRRLALRSTGWCFVGLGIFTLLVRRVGGDTVVDGLVRTESIKPAVHSTWSISTSLLRTIAISMVIYGLVLVLAAVLAGPSRPAKALRRALAPTLRDHPLRTYGAVAIVYLLVLVWGPTPALRHWIPILLIAALIVLGVELLRRQTAREFPDARAGDTAQALRDWREARRSDAGKPPAPAEGNGGRLAELERLASLHERGALTDEEYSAQKGVLLGGG
jgi:Short C-terminal domain